MSKIRIKNFGPIKEGYLQNDGWIDIGKVTVFIGNQGSGKSTVAKAISVMTWLEKAFVREDFEAGQSLFRVGQFFDYQNLKNYLKEDTIIEYIGDYYEISYTKYNESPGIFHADKKVDTATYKLPKIMYVPAERNFLSVIKNAFDVKGLPEALSTFGEELRRTQQELNNQLVDLPINDLKYQYDISEDSSYVIGGGYKLSLNEASSGLQSTIPLFLVSKNIADQIDEFDLLAPMSFEPFNEIIKKIQNSLSINHRIKVSNEMRMIQNDTSLSDDERFQLIANLLNRFHSRVFINIVEEPEQNLYPSSQKKILESLLEFNNMNEGNKLIMTTHSPYLINYLTLAVKAGELKEKIGDNEQLQDQLNQIVPAKSIINSNDLAIYEFDEKDGSIKRLAVYNGLPSDENELNLELGETNELFAQLLEIEQSI